MDVAYFSSSALFSVYGFFSGITKTKADIQRRNLDHKNERAELA
jgi:hypothetical protein